MTRHGDVTADGMDDEVGRAPRARRRMSGDERRSDLVAHAVRSYTDLGLGRAGHGDVARRAGVSTPTVFNYFPTREALTEAVLDEVRTGGADLFDAVDMTGDAVGDLETLRATLHAACLAEPERYRLFLSWAYSFSPDVRPAFRAYRDSIIDRLEPFTATRVDAHILYGAGILYVQMVMDGLEDEVTSGFTARLGELLARPG